MQRGAHRRTRWRGRRSGHKGWYVCCGQFSHGTGQYDQLMRFDVSSNPIRLAMIAPIGGALIFAVYGTFSIGRQGRFDFEQIAISTIFGFLAGIASILYVLPLLTWTDVRRSVPLAYGGPIVVALFLGLWNHSSYAFPVLCGLHLALCVGSAIFLRKTERGAMECPHCRYLTRGLRVPRCPECGLELVEWKAKNSAS
jgi:hypothetical protein